MENKTAVIEIMKPLAFMDMDYYIQDVPLHALNHRMVFVRKGVSGSKMISTKNVKLLKVFDVDDKEGIKSYIEKMKNKNINEGVNMISEGILKLPQEVINKIDYLADMYEKGKYNKPHPNYFQFKNSKNQNISVSVVFKELPRGIDGYTINLFKGNPISSDYGRFENQYEDEIKPLTTSIIKPIEGVFYFVIAISPSLGNIKRFKDVITHELLHTIDPKITNHLHFYSDKFNQPNLKKLKNVFSDYSYGDFINSTKEKYYSSGRENYFKSFGEFDAESPVIIGNTIQALKSIVKKDGIKGAKKFYNEFLKFLTRILNYSREWDSDPKLQRIYPIKDEAVFETAYNQVKGVKNKDLFLSIFNYDSGKTYPHNNFLYEWINKPTLYKRFLQRLGKEAASEVFNKNINESIDMKKVISEGLKYHLSNGISVNESIYRPGSEAHIDLLAETRELYDSGLIELDSDDEDLFESTDIGRFGKFRGEVVPLDVFLIEYDGGEYEDNDDISGEVDIDEVEEYLKEKGWGDLAYENFIDFEKSDYYTGTLNSKSYANEMNKYMSDLSTGLIESIIEEGKKTKKKKHPPLGKIRRNSGSGKKYVVYVKNPSTGKIKKITFGDKKGGLRARTGNAKARKSFSARHNCAKKKDRMTAGYWACRLTRSGLFGKNKTTSGYW